jgi:hypothetical protein
MNPTVFTKTNLTIFTIAHNLVDLICAMPNQEIALIELFLCPINRLNALIMTYMHRKQNTLKWTELSLKPKATTYGEKKSIYNQDFKSLSEGVIALHATNMEC